MIFKLPRYRDTIPGLRSKRTPAVLGSREESELSFLNPFRGLHVNGRDVEVSMPEVVRPNRLTSKRKNKKKLSRPEYKALAEFRYQIRKYLRYMEEAARSYGYHPQQYQLLLAIEGLPDGKTPTIKALAERMQLNHNSTVELVDRCEKRKLLQRTHDGVSRREVTLVPTSAGIRMMEDQASSSQAELREIGPVLFTSLQRLMEQAPPEIIARSNISRKQRR